MPTEPQDKTRVAQPIVVPSLSPEELRRIKLNRLLLVVYLNLDLLWDADKVKKYENMLNFYNNNFFGYGLLGRLTNYDPRTPEGLVAILSNFDYAKGNALTFGELLGTAVIGEGATQAIRYATTPVKIGSGAEAVVSSAPLSTKVTKVTTIPRSEMHARNMVPGALRSRYVGTTNGLNTYTLSKVKIISGNKIQSATKAIEKVMSKRGWRKITHPNLLGVGFTNGRSVVSDLGYGNIGRDWLGRVRLTDFTLESVPLFRLAMQRAGGKIHCNFKIN